MICLKKWQHFSFLFVKNGKVKIFITFFIFQQIKKKNGFEMVLKALQYAMCLFLKESFLKIHVPWLNTVLVWVKVQHSCTKGND